MSLSIFNILLKLFGKHKQALENWAHCANTKFVLTFNMGLIPFRFCIFGCRQNAKLHYVKHLSDRYSAGSSIHLWKHHSIWITKFVSCIYGWIWFQFSHRDNLHIGCCVSLLRYYQINSNLILLCMANIVRDDKILMRHIANFDSYIGLCMLSNKLLCIQNIKKLLTNIKYQVDIDVFVKVYLCQVKSFILYFDVGLIISSTKK